MRLVFAPEQQAAFFGGDPDNFTYPRYDLDMALFRVYENGKPIDSTNYLKWNPKGAADGELVFVSGHPGGTQRLDTMPQLESERDIATPLHHSRAEAPHRHAERLLRTRPRACASSRLRTSSVWRTAAKAIDGANEGPADQTVMDKKRKDEDDFKAQVMRNPEWKNEYGDAWDEIADAMNENTSRASRSSSSMEPTPNWPARAQSS